MDEESARGATGSVYYFLDLYRYAFMTGNTTELAAMSDDQCKFCQSTINDADDAHKKGGWANKWDQEIVSATYYEKLEGYDYNRIKVVINYGATISCHEAGAQPQSSEPINGQILNFGVHQLPRRQLRRSPMPLKSAGPPGQGLGISERRAGVSSHIPKHRRRQTAHQISSRWSNPVRRAQAPSSSRTRSSGATTRPETTSSTAR